MLKSILLLISLSSCMKISPYIMRPSGELRDRDCVYHNYGKLPPCNGYNYLPVDKVTRDGSREVVVIINDYSQYKGR
jgi:hypothetical protein